jgi:sulfate adenylyltransferase large subunit
MTKEELYAERMNIVIVGHVDHGKSTLVGRLLVDTGAIGPQKISQVKTVCEKLGKPFEYAFLLDALKDERTQGITIDTARIFFRSGRREYIILDAPGHIEFLKNMITGAAKAEAALLLIDAKEGIAENSRRHGLILSMIGLKQVVVLVNKMDTVDYDEEIFTFLKRQYAAFLGELDVKARHFIPISAKEGDNVAQRSGLMPWYDGPTVLEALDGFGAARRPDETALRMPVQDVYKFDERRIVAGTVESGSFKKGDRVVFFPSGKTSTVESIETFAAEAPVLVPAGRSTGVTLGRQLYIRPGDIMCRAGDGDLRLRTGSRFRAKIFWMGRAPLREGRLYKLKLAMKRVGAFIEDVEYVLDSETLEKSADLDLVDRNNIAVCTVRTVHPLSYDLFEDCEATGRFALVDNYQIAGGGTIIEELQEGRGEDIAAADGRREEFELELNAFVRKWFPHWEAKKIE